MDAILIDFCAHQVLRYGAIFSIFRLSLLNTSIHFISEIIGYKFFSLRDFFVWWLGGSRSFSEPPRIYYL